MNAPNIFLWFFQTYALGIFFKRYRTTSMRLERIERERKEALEREIRTRLEGETANAGTSPNLGAEKPLAGLNPA